jgi:hypothetical protein
LHNSNIFLIFDNQIQKMKESKFKKHEELISELYEAKNKNITHVAKALAENLGKEYNDSFRRKLSSFVNNHIDVKCEVEETEDFKEAQKRKFGKNDTYIVTHAQNSTPINSKVWENIKAYADYRGATLVVIAGRYKNPTSVFGDRKQESWDKNVLPYLTASRLEIHKHLTILGDIKVQATSSRPLARKNLIAGQKTCIVGHPRLHLETVPRLPSYTPKVLLTTGTVTLPNYTDSDSGKIAEAHHTYGFTIFEKISEEEFLVRQVSVEENGDFYDKEYFVSDKGVEKKFEVDTVVLGDVHHGKHDQKLLDKVEDFINDYKVKNVVLHDVYDGYAVRKHDIKNPVKEYLAHKKGTNNIKDEIETVLAFLDNWKKYNLTIVHSNHHEHLDQYVALQDWRKDPLNAATYNSLLQVLLEEKAPKGLFAYLVDEKFGGEIKTLNHSDSFIRKGTELSCHGHLGINGARGANNSFLNLSTKMIKAHDHTMYRRDGVISTGTVTKYDMGYNRGLTTWLQGFTIIHPNGKAQQLINVNYKF